MATEKFRVASVGTSVKPDLGVPAGLEEGHARAMTTAFTSPTLPRSTEFIVSAPRGVGKSMFAEMLAKRIEMESKKAMDVLLEEERPKPATGWRMTSVRWLEDKFPHYVRRVGPGSDRLLRALEAMRYGDADEELSSGSGLMGTAADLRKRMVDRWDEAEHRLMASYLNAGGYEARRAELGAKDDSIMLEGADDVPELPELRVVENGGRGGEAPRDSAEPEADEETLEAAVAHSSPFAGSW